MTFINNSNTTRPVLNSVHETSFLMGFPLVLLSIGSIFVGYLMKDFFIGLGISSWGTSIFVLPDNLNFIEAEFLPCIIKLVPLFLSVSGIFISFYINLNFNFFFIKLKKFNFFLFLIFLINKK